MLLSLNWLRDYLAKPDIKFDPYELAEKMTMRGLPVASIKNVTTGLESVIAGQIIKIEKHPNADRLQVTQVVFSHEENAPRHQVVCGAKNISEGDVVPVALPGAILPGDFAIKVSQIRGVESKGMICSGKELGLSDDSDGILQLPKHSTLGDPISRLLGKGTDDIVMEFELTPNRADCLSVIGLAREIAPLLKTKIREHKPPRFRTSPHRTSSIIKVEVDDTTLCPRYVARVMDNLKVTESPDWIKQRLQSVGIRPINNIVDITNLVMIEFGQPLHAFDLRKIESGLIKVGACKRTTDFTLLTGETVELQENDIVIMDGERPIALAGIMGGANSQISADTTSIVLESAVFSRSHIRRTAKRLGLQTDASKRFEKGCDVDAVALASERAAVLLRDSFNAEVYHPPIDTNEEIPKDRQLSIDMRDVRKLTGLDNLDTELVADSLETIGIGCHRKSVNILSLKVPSFRVDLNESVDIIEEIARLHGYENIPQKFPESSCSYDRLDESLWDFEYRARGILSQMGLRETIHYSFTSEENLNRFGLLPENAVRLKNPISEEMKVLRTSLLPSLINTYLYNKNRHVEEQRLFEIAKVYNWDPQEETQVKEVLYAAGLVSGTSTPSNWKFETKPVDFFFGKGLVETLTRQLTTVFTAYEPVQNSRLFHPKRSAVLKLGLKEIGFVGEIHPFVRDNYLDTKEPVVLFEINLEALRKYERTGVRYKIPSKFPGSDFDIALVVDKTIAYQNILDEMKKVGGPLLQSVNLFDVYEGENIPEGKRSLAFHFEFHADDKTLQDEEIVGFRNRIVQAVSEKFSAQLR